MKSLLTVRLSNDLDREISDIAEKLHLKRSDIIRLALKKFLEEFRDEEERNRTIWLKTLSGKYQAIFPTLEKRIENILYINLKSMRNILLDTGAFVTLPDRSENNHERTLAFFKEFKGQLFTTEPVLTETLYLLGSSVKARKICIEFIIKGGATLVPQSIKSLSRAIELMEKYNDTPMDFSDATLLTLAEETGIQDVFTLDVKGFNTYRIHGKKAFSVWPK